MKTKKGISPIIATILILGFTVVLAAIFVTWGSGFFQKTQESTENTVRLSTVCTNVATNIKLTPKVSVGTLELAVDNGGQYEINGFIFRVYNAGETTADVFDTEVPSTIPPMIISPLVGDFSLAAQNLKTYVLDYDETKITTLVKVGVKPKVTIAGKQETCGEITKDL